MAEQSSFNQSRFRYPINPFQHEGVKAVGIVLVAIFAIVVIAGMVYGATLISSRQRSTVLPATTAAPSPTVTAIPTIPVTPAPTEVPVVIPTEVPQTMISPTLPAMVTVTVSPAGQF